MLEALPASAMERDLEIRESARVRQNLTSKDLEKKKTIVMKTFTKTSNDEDEREVNIYVLNMIELWREFEKNNTKRCQVRMKVLSQCFLLCFLDILEFISPGRWKLLWCAMQGAMTSEDFCLIRTEQNFAVFQ